MKYCPECHKKMQYQLFGIWECFNQKCKLVSMEFMA